MFTGLIEEVGRIVDVAPHEGGRRFRIAAQDVLEGLEAGASVAIDGACHTVVEAHADGFDVQSVATTLERTTFGRFHPGTRVNLERALALGARLGGHLVQGHVDGVGEVRSVEHHGDHVLIDLMLPAIVAEVTILHGSITVSGISLTVNAMPRGDIAQVSIIPHTWEVTNLPDLSPGSPVNLEGDLIGKYVRKLLGSPSTDGDEQTAGGAEHLRRVWGY
ncbi:MAG: riboflavin synthase [Gemmatimonadota bacterium]